MLGDWAEMGPELLFRLLKHFQLKIMCDGFCLHSLGLLVSPQSALLA